MSYKNVKLKLTLLRLSTREAYVPPLNIRCDIMGAKVLLDGVDTGKVTNARFLRWREGVYSLEKSGYEFTPESITESEMPQQEKTIDFIRVTGTLAVPDSPVMGAFTLINDDGFTVNWAVAETGNAATGFYVKIYDANDELQYTIDTESGEATSQVVTGLDANTEYHIALTAYNLDGESDPATAEVTTYYAETQAYLTAMGESAPTDIAITGAYNQLVKDLKTAVVGEETIDILAKLDCLYLFYTAHDTATDTLINVIDPSGMGIGPAVLGKGAGSYPTWAAKAGFTTDGSQNYINTDFAYVASGGGKTKYSTHATDGSSFGLVQHADTPADSHYNVGAREGTTIIRINSRDSSNYPGTNHHAGSTSWSLLQNTSTRYIISTRPTSDNLACITENGNQSTSVPEVAIPTNKLFIGARNFTTVDQHKVTYPSIFFAGSGLTVAEATAMIGIFGDYMTAMGAI